MSRTACAQPTGELRTAKAKLRGEIPTNPQPAWLGDAVRQTVHRERGLSKVIADALDCAEYHVTDLADPTRRVALRAHEIVPMVLAARDYRILDAIEAAVGRVAFALPSVNPHADEMTRELARAVKQFGAFLETNGEALADGKLEAHEVPPMLGSIDSMIADLSTYRAMVVVKARLDGAR